MRLDENGGRPRTRDDGAVTPRPSQRQRRCTGVRKTGPATFVWEARDYVPNSDLRILVVSNDDAFLGIK